jgi:site-specific DNA recombinase
MQDRNGVKVVGIWLRVSTEDQVRGESPEHHFKRASAYAEAKGWKVAEVYRLDAVSGKSVMGHAEAKRMLADVRAGRITGLVFSKLARLARNTRELLEFAETFRECGADLISLHESIDTSSPAGRLFFTMIAAMAQWEREEIADRVAASVPIRAKLGKPIGGAAPFGYRWQDKRLVPDPEEAPVRVLVHELFKEHQRKKTVARMLNERGYRTRNGSNFSATTVGRLILDTTARGQHRANYTYTIDAKKRWRVKPESEWVYTEVEPIVPAELWDECERILLGLRAQRRTPTRRNVHLFSGFAECTCGTKMYVHTGSPKYVCAACKNKIPIDDLEAVFRDQLRNFVISPEEVAAHNEAADEARHEKERLINVAEKELRRIDSDSDTLFRLYGDGKLSGDDFARRNDPLSERRRQLEDELPKLQASLDVLKIATASRAETLSEARDLAARWEQLTDLEKRQIVEAIAERVIVGKEDVEVSLLYLPSGDHGAKGTRPHGFIAATSWIRDG